MSFPLILGDIDGQPKFTNCFSCDFSLVIYFSGMSNIILYMVYLSLSSSCFLTLRLSLHLIWTQLIAHKWYWVFDALHRLLSTSYDRCPLLRPDPNSRDIGAPGPVGYFLRDYYSVYRTLFLILFIWLPRSSTVFSLWGISVAINDIRILSSWFTLVPILVFCLVPVARDLDVWGKRWHSKSASSILTLLLNPSQRKTWSGFLLSSTQIVLSW